MTDQTNTPDGDAKTPEIEGIKTPQEIEEFCERYGWQVPKSPDQILQLVRGFEYDDALHALSIDLALHQLHALIREEVIGEPVDFPHDSQVGAPIGTDGFIGYGRNLEKNDAGNRLSRLFGIEGGPDDDSIK